MLDLRVLEHLIDRVDRPAGNAGRVEFGNPLLARLGDRARVDLGVERVAVLRARRCRRVVGIVDPFRRTQRLAQALPDAAAGGGDVDVAVRRLEYTGRNAGWMIVAGLR